MKRIIVLLVMVLSCTLVFASGQTDASMASGTAVNPPGTLPIVDETITLTSFIPGIGFINDVQTNAAVIALEEATNVHIEWLEATKTDAENKVSILLASGDYPGMFLGCGGNGLSVQKTYNYGTQGLFLALDDAIDRLGYYIKDLFEAEPWARDAMRSADGNTYSFAYVRTDDYHMTMRNKLFLNYTWLENLGIDEPKTLDEFYDMLVAFKTKDANGNGDPNDEIPLTGSKRSVEDTAMWIMNAFLPAGGGDDSGDSLLNQYEFIVDGKVFFNADKPEFREGLRFLNKIYKEGLYDVAALTQDRDQVKPLVDGGDATRVGGMASHHPGNFGSMSDLDNGRFRQYFALPSITGPNGHASTPWFIDSIIQPDMLVITDKVENFDAAVRWADYFYSLDFAMLDRGVEGVHWRRVDPSEGLIGINGDPAKYAYIKTITMEDNAQINMCPGWSRDIKNEFAKEAGFNYEYFLYSQTKKLEPYKIRRYPWATAKIPEDSSAEFVDLRKTIHTFIGESVDRFIIGDLDIEKDWDSYVKQLNDIGLERWLKILESGIQ